MDSPIFHRHAPEVHADLEALATSEGRLTLALESARKGLFDYDISSGHVHGSPTLHTSRGYSPGEFPANLARLNQHLTTIDATARQALRQRRMLIHALQLRPGAGRPGRGPEAERTGGKEGGRAVYQVGVRAGRPGASAGAVPWLTAKAALVDD